MSEQLMNNKDCKLWRFPCECMSREHSLDVCLYRYGSRDHFLSCEFDMMTIGGSSLIFRIKQAWNILLGKDAEMMNFVLRKDDSEMLSNLLKEYSEGAEHDYAE